MGPAGRLVDEVFKQAGIDPLQDVVWTNSSGCRPCGTRWAADRPPTLTERLACSQRLGLSLRAIRPRVVLCLGKHATCRLWDEPPPENEWYTQESDGEKVVVGVMRHPSALLRAMMTNYREFFAAKMFLRRLKLSLHGLKKVSTWTLLPKYLTDFAAEGRPVCGR